MKVSRRRSVDSSMCRRTSIMWMLFTSVSIKRSCSLLARNTMYSVQTFWTQDIQSHWLLSAYQLPWRKSMVPWSGVIIKGLISSVAPCTGGKFNISVDIQFNIVLYVYNSSACHNLLFCKAIYIEFALLEVKR